jgi:hypothetical protein
MKKEQEIVVRIFDEQNILFNMKSEEIFFVIFVVVVVEVGIIMMKKICNNHN